MTHSTAPGPEPTVTLSALHAVLLTETLTDIDEFLRAGSVGPALTEFMTNNRGHKHPACAATALLDAVGFHAMHMRELAAGVHARVDAHAGFVEPATTDGTEHS